MEKRNTIPAYLRLMRLHQPVGVLLLLWPCFWALALSGAGWRYYAAFALGAVCMRAAGCIINDMWDRDFDREVARTRLRPLASGELSLRQALVLLALLLALSLGVALYLGERVVWWSAAALPPVIVYPLMKRITFWPQLFLGLTFNWGALLGFVAATGGVNETALLLYISGIFWTLGYDTVYAHQDKHDDVRIGVKSTALALGSRSKIFVAACYGAALMMWWVLVWESTQVWPVIMLVAAGFFWQIKSWRMEDLTSCRRLFLSGGWMGGVVWFAMLLSY